jgi:AmmeMemoRadiSam system protein A
MSQLNETDQRLLLKIARQAVYAYLTGKAPRPPEITDGILSEARGVFVTLRTKDGELRGCIGNIHPATPLCRTTADCAISAAVGDPRFAPLTMDEFPGVDFEISVLFPMQKVEDVNSIEVGRDGIFISKKGARGLLLPQVATEYGWDRNRFLAETCRKAGLKADEWKDGATIFRFTAHVFDEKKPQPK